MCISSFTIEEEENYAKTDVPFELETALTKQGGIFRKTGPWQAYIALPTGISSPAKIPLLPEALLTKMVKLLEAA
jgi:hypothetical protein